MSINLDQPPAPSGFYIVNETDRPDPERLAERQPDGALNYVHPDLRNVDWYWGMPIDWATPVEDFGVFVEIKDGILRGRQLALSTAKYADGRGRRWQGPAEFQFPL